MIELPPLCITEYRTVSDASVKNFDMTVNSLLKDGWKLYGKSKQRYNDIYLSYIQTMVKYERI